MKYVLRIYWKRLGSHTHTRVFMGNEKERFSGLGKAGDLCLRNEEWDALLAQVGGGDVVELDLREE